jgi:hypothetical protein
MLKSDLPDAPPISMPSRVLDAGRCLSMINKRDSGDTAILEKEPGKN